MRNLCLAILTLAVLPACNGIPTPEPTPEPTPGPTPWECPLEVPRCDLLEPPQQCSTEESPCWHNPTQDPESCEYAPDCDPMPPEPTPPPPSTACVTESDLDPIDCPTPGADFQDEVKKATNTLGDLRGRPPQENLQKLAEQLQVQMPGRCLIGGIEAVFILRDDGSYEENHAVFFGNGAWTNSGRGVFVGCHEDTDPNEPPAPTPPPGGETCVDPDPTGLEAEFVLKPHGNDWDSTYRVRSRQYCDAVCSPLEPDVCFTGRNACPLRFEGDPEREACEAQEIGEQQWWCNGQSIESNENPAQARCHGHVKTCTENGRTCGEADW